jgi:hypothetical protein
MPRVYPLDPPLVRKIVTRRRALRWSQNYLALEAGLTEGHVQKLETLRLGVSPAARRAIEAALERGEHQAAACAPSANGGAR